MDDKFVEVLDIEIKTVTSGLTLHHTIREHEGDRVIDGANTLQIRYGDREVMVGHEKRRIAGRTVTIPLQHIIELSRTPRFEPRVRPSAAVLMNADRAKAAEIKALADRLVSAT